MVRLDKNALSNIYIFCGNEAYKKKNYVNQLKKIIAGDGSINYAFYSGKNINFQDVYDSAVTLPFFVDKRLVIVENSGAFKNKKKKKSNDDSEPETDSSLEESDDNRDKIIEKLLNEVPLTTCLVFLEEETNANKKLYKLAISKGQAIQCNADTKDDIVVWLAKGFAQAGKNIRRSTAEMIVDRIGCDYNRLKTEVEKLISYVGESNEITDADVRAITSENIEDRIFDLLDAMCVKDIKTVLNKYYGLLANRIHPLNILSMLRRQFRILLQVEECLQDNMSVYETMSVLKLAEFVVKKNFRYTKYFSTERVENILEKICDVDKNIKIGGIDAQLGVELLIVEFSR